MKQLKPYIILVVLAFLFGACNIKRHVPNDEYLLISNKVEIPKKTEVDKSEAENVIRQRPNHKTFWVYRMKLRIYNSVDSTKAANSRKKRIVRYKVKNKKRLLREEKVNQRRIAKAIKRGDSLYTPKVIELKDTLDPKPTLRERIKYDWGEAPVIYDSTLMDLSKDQLRLFMQKKGYFNAEVETMVLLNAKKKEAKVKYIIEPKEKYTVDSLYLRTSNVPVKEVYERYLKKGKDVLTTPFRFDSNNLGKMRRSMAEFMRNSGIYGFRESYISFEVDTLNHTQNITVAIDIAPKIIGKGEGEHVKPFAYTKVRNVTFHMLDTMAYKGNFKMNELDKRDITLKSYDQIPTFDTLRYDWYKRRNAQFRTATFLYNGRLTTRPELVEFQNYLEENNMYGGDYLSQTYNRLMNLNVFLTIMPEVTENEDNSIDVDYYLTPKKQRTFSFEPKGTHNNSFLGLSASLNYINRNLFRRGHKFKVSLSGGFESQPEVFGKNDEETVLDGKTRSFNTIEFGPSLELEMPGLFPIPLTRLSKRQNPSTAVGLAYYFQKRPEFKRQIIQWNYMWKFMDVYRTQTFSVGIPVIGGIQFVRINKTDKFQNQLIAQNDIFLLNAYSNQAIYKDLALSYSYINRDLKDGNMAFNYIANLDMAGMIISAITNKNPVNADGYKEFLGQRYSQFIRIDNQFVLNHSIDKVSSVHYRLQLGLGIPLKNNGPSLPFDYSFFGGGSNDNRGFSARTLGPGTYKSYLDTNRTLTQLGDMRLGASFEYRFKMSKLFEGAFFSDVGNIWGLNEDPNRLGGQISKNFYKELSVSAGFGLRLDFTYVIVRLDVGIPFRNPALPDNAKWIFQSRDPYYQEAIDAWGVNPDTGDYYYKDYKYPKPFRPHFHLAIGYPF